MSNINVLQKNRIGGGSNPLGKNFISDNREVLDKIQQNANGYLQFTNKQDKTLIIGQSLTVINGDQQLQDGTNNQVYNNISTIVFSNAKNLTLLQDNKTLVVTLDQLEDHLDQSSNVVFSYYDIKILSSGVKQYNVINSGQYLICDHAVTVNLPSIDKNISYVKIATIAGVDQLNTVKINTNSEYINEKNCKELILDVAYSSVQLIYNPNNNIWMLLTPFVPIQNNINGLDEGKQRALMKKNVLLYG